MKHRNMLKVGAGFAGLLALASPLSSAWALTVTSPGLVLMIDGTDPNVTVNIGVGDVTFPVGRYDFGFVTGSTYTMITSTAASYTFTGGTVVDFALRDTWSNTVYSISNPADYATQIYLGTIPAANSQNPVVTSDYYKTLTLLWDLNNDTIADAGFDIAASTPLWGNDGMAPTPVPVPAAIWLLGSGMVGVLGLGARRRKTSATV